MTERPYGVEILGPVRSAITEPLPEAVAVAVLEFCDRPLTKEPAKVGKALFGSLLGCHGARRASYRIVYRIDYERHLVQVLDVAHRRDIYGHR